MSVSYKESWRRCSGLFFSSLAPSIQHIFSNLSTHLSSVTQSNCNYPIGQSISTNHNQPNHQSTTTMSYLHYTRERERERSPYTASDPYYSRPLVRRNSKRQRVDLYSSDDEYDDYPYASSPAPVVQPVKPSRSLTIRQPSQLEKYNVWSYTPNENSRAHDRYDDDQDGLGQRYKYTTTTSHKHYVPRASPRPIVLPSDDEDEDNDRHEREFRLKVKASFGRPKASLSRSNSISHNAYGQAQKAMAWSGDLFKRREKWEGVDYESRERSRGSETRGFWEDEPKAVEKEVRFRRVKRTRTDEWRPLSGFRRG